MRTSRKSWIPLQVALAALPGCRAPAQETGLVDRSSPLQVVEADANERDLRITPVVRAVQRAADSVVSIYVLHQGTRREAVTEGQGSGVLLDEYGLAITNWHVIAPLLLADPRTASLSLLVRLRDGREREAGILSSSANRDLALLQLRLADGERVKPIEIGRSADLMIGETVIAIGNPQGHANTVTSGVLSATDRTIQVRTPDGVVRSYTDLLQTDAAINQGNSGGALLDITGRLIGINNAMAVGAENIGFAIPMDVVRREFERELIQSQGFVAAPDAPWIGLEVQERDNAIVVTEVVPDGPAAAAGIRVGDVLRRLGPHELKSAIDYLRKFYDLRPGRPVAITISREGRSAVVEVRPMARDQGFILAAIGAVVDELDAERHEPLVRKVTLAFHRGSGLRRVPLFPAALRLERVLPDSPAESVGLEAGDILLAVFARTPFGEREVPLTSRRDLARLLDQERGKSLRIAVLRGDRDLVGTIDVRREPPRRR